MNNCKRSPNPPHYGGTIHENLVQTAVATQIGFYDGFAGGKTVKILKKAYNTVGVRFLRGSTLHKGYTYKVPKKVKLHLGEEIIVPSAFNGFLSNTIAVVVELHSTPQDTGPYDYKFIVGRIAWVK